MGFGFATTDSKNTDKGEMIDPRCIVKFRPADDWKGEYGFDWFREGDYGEKDKNTGRISSHYKNSGLIGKYFGKFRLCKGDESRPETTPDKEEFTDAKGNMIYSTWAPNRQLYVTLRSKKICLRCQSKTSCNIFPLQNGNGAEYPFSYENTRKPVKIDPDLGSDNICDFLTQGLSFYNTNPYERNFEYLYTPILINDNPPENYYVPIVSLFYKNVSKEKEGKWGQSKATVNLLITGKNIDTDIGNITLEFESSEGVEKLNDIKGSTITNNVTICNVKYYITTIDIKLSNAFSKHSVNTGDGSIKVYAKSSVGRFLAGKLTVEKCIPKRVDIVFIPIISQLPGSAKVVFKGISEQASNLKQYLSQAQIVPNIFMFNPNNFSVETLNKIDGVINSHIQDVRDSNGNVIGKALDPDKGKDMGKQLETLFNEDKSNSWLKYRNAYKIFLFGEKAKVKIDSQGFESRLLGRSNGNPSNAATIFSLEGSNNTSSTICHELLHCLGLWHSFSNNSPYTLEKAKTSNIMDYPVSPFELQTLWKWQWDIIRKASGVKPLDGNIVDKLLPKINLPKVRMK